MTPNIFYMMSRSAGQVECRHNFRYCFPEYPLTQEDVEIYLELMRTTPEYFESLIDFEKRNQNQDCSCRMQLRIR